MKKFMYMCMMLLAATLTFTACGSDDDDDNGGGQGGSSITANQILGTWYGVDENSSERVNIFVVTLNQNGQGVYSEYKAKAKNNWATERQSTNMTWTLLNGTLSMTANGETLKGDLLSLNGNSLRVKRYLGDGKTDVITLTRVSGGEQEIISALDKLVAEKNGGGGQGGNEVNQDNYYKYQESVDVTDAGTITVIGEATFENGKCTAIAITFVYPTKSIAKQIWESYQNDPEMADELPYYSYDGDKTMSYRFDEQTVASISAMGKDYVCKTVKSTVQATVEALRKL